MKILAPTPVPVAWPRTIASWTGRRTIAMWVLIVAACMPMVDPIIMAYLLPKIAPALQMSTTESALAASLATLVMAATIIPVGILGDRIGRKRVFVASLALLVLSEVVCALSQTSGAFLAGRFFAGLGEAGAYSMSMALLATLFASAEMNRVIGRLFATVAAVGGIALVLASYLSAINWRLAIIIFPVLGLVLLVGSILSIPESKGTVRKFDTVGSVLGGLGLTSFIIGLGQASTSGWTSAAVLVPVVVGISLIIALFMYESRIDHAGLPMDLLRRPTVAACLVVIVLANFAIGTITVLFPILTEQAFGWAPLKYLGVLFGLMVGQFVGSLFAGRKNNSRRSEFALVVSGLALTTASLTMLALGGADTPTLYYFFAMLLLGMGISTGVAAGAAGVMTRAPKDRLGAASAVKPVAVQVGTALGLGAMLPIMTAFMANGQPGNAAAAAPHAFSITMLIAAAVVAGGAVMSFVLLRRDARDVAEISDAESSVRGESAGNVEPLDGFAHVSSDGVHGIEKEDALA